MCRILRIFPLLFALVVPANSLADRGLPASLIRLPESVTTVFIAETSTAEFHRFLRSDNDITYSESTYMSIGEEGPGKQRSGDKRTPLGVYFITEQLDTSKLHEKYGATAFPLDYPNAWDQHANRDGDGIWVHGMYAGGGQRPERDTDGCIALPNKDLLMLASDFKDNVTPVLVTRKVDWGKAPENDSLRSELENRIAEWVDSKANGDLFTYLSLYSEDFGRWEMDKAEWSSFKLQTVAQREISQATISELLLLGYPDEAELYLSRFRLTVVEGSRATVSTTRLYWRREAGGALKIIAEDDG